MKAIVFIALITASYNSHAQGQQPLPASYDSLLRKVASMEIAVNNIHNNMVKAHSQYITGSIVLLTGLAIAAIGVSSNSSQSNGSTLIGIGSTISLVGGFIVIDSNKYLGRGGRKEKKKSR